MSEHGRDLALDGLKASPVAIVGFGHWLMGVNWQPIVLMITAAYSVCILIEKLYKGWKWLRQKRGD